MHKSSSLRFHLIGSVSVAYLKRESECVCFLQLLLLYCCKVCSSTQTEFLQSIKTKSRRPGECMAQFLFSIKNLSFFLHLKAFLDDFL